MSKKITSDTLSQEKVDEFVLLNPLLNSMHLEVKILSQKKPDGILNLMKVKMINKILQRLKTLLQNEATIEFIELLDEDSLPSNSDALFMIVQFQTAMKKFANRYQYQDSNYNWAWNIKK